MTSSVGPAVASATGGPSTPGSDGDSVGAEFAALLASATPVTGGDGEQPGTPGQELTNGAEDTPSGEPGAPVVPVVPCAVLAVLPSALPSAGPAPQAAAANLAPAVASAPAVAGGEVAAHPGPVPGDAADAGEGAPIPVRGRESLAAPVPGTAGAGADPAGPAAPALSAPSTSAAPLVGAGVTAPVAATAQPGGDASSAASALAPGVDPSAGPSVPVTATPVTVLTATGPDLSLAPTVPGRPAPLPGQVAAHVQTVVVHGDGSYAMTVHAHPADLGPVTISVRVTDSTVHVDLASIHEQARAALTEAAPSIRRELAVAGLTCERVNVSADLASSGQDYRQAGHDAQMADRDPNRGSPQDRRARTRMDSGEPHETQPVALVTTQTTSSGVDVRV